MGRITVKAFQEFLGVSADGIFGIDSKNALFARFSNKNAAAITNEDIETVANRLGVKPAVIKAVRKVEAPRGAFDTQGRPTILFEKHIFGGETSYKFNQTHPDLSASSWRPGTYGPSSNQWNRLAAACALDPESAFRSCSWGAFQVMGNNAEGMEYASVFDMALQLVESEVKHLECFERYVKMRKLEDELRMCRAGDAQSCVPFVSKYNGPGYAKNKYHINFAREIARG